MATLHEEISRRRTFAIISHPDAGKTTLTEKFLLYGGAIAQAGEVKGKRARAATSDWMEIEKQRGISVTSSVMQFQHGGYCINILDTPGHQDFSEDTYRTLMAADSAVMVIDGAKGVEPQTRKLFKRLRPAPHPHLHLHQQDGPRDARPARAAARRSSASLASTPTPSTGPSAAARNFRAFTTAQKQMHHPLHRRGPREEGRRDRDRAGRSRAGRTHWAEARATASPTRSSCSARGREFDLDAVRNGTLSPVFFGSRADELRRGAVPGGLSAHDHRRPCSRESDAGVIDAVLPRLLRLRVQDPGEHEQGAPRPSGVHAHLLGQVRARRGSITMCRATRRCACPSRRP